MLKNVIVYSTPSCPVCLEVEDYLKSGGVAFTEYNVADDEKKADEAFKKSGQMGVPVIDIDGEIFVGFDRERINNLLGIK